MAFAAEDLVPISALQHLLFCPRQCALIHNEGQWAENQYTAEGRVLHERVDDGRPELRDGVKVERSVALRSLRLGVTGIADVVEMRPKQPPFLVEYKRGRPKAHRADEVQICAQAICLEEMLGVDIPGGALFYGRTRRRMEVAFDAVLRNLTEEIASQTRSLLREGATPLPQYEERKCNACSLQDACQPRAPLVGTSVAQWLMHAIEEQGRL